jgi:hypothetical protein
MEIAILTGGLFLLGKTLLPSKTPREVVKDADVSSNLSLNIYNSNATKIVQNKEKQILDKRFEDSKDPKRTNIINQGTINRECGFECAYEEPSFAHPSVLPMVSKTNGLETDSFSPLFDTPSYLSKNTNTGSLSGKNIVMTHNNMAPHFKGHIKQNLREYANERKLETFTGVSNQTTIEKEAQGPMFAPVKQQTTPGIFKLEKDRYIPSNYMQHSKPFPEVREKPIPAHALRPIYKTIDELRVIPKNTIEGVIQFGQKLKLTNNNVNNTVYKDTSYKNERDGVQRSNFLKPKQRENYDICKPDMGDTYYTGIANKVRTKDTYMNLGEETKKIDKTKEFNHVRNLKGILKNNDFERTSFEPVETQRETASMEVWGNIAKPNIGVKLYGNIQAPTTMKECNLFDYTGNMRGHSKFTSRDKEYYNNTKRESENPENLPQGPKISANMGKQMLKTENNMYRFNQGGIGINDIVQQKQLLTEDNTYNNRLIPEMVSQLKNNELSIYNKK